MMSTRAVLGFIAAASLAGAAACASQKPQYAINYAEARAEIPNGLKLIVMPDPSTPMVQVDVRYEVGSNEDPSDKAGLAHYVEHMMFQFRLFGEDGPPLFSMLPQIATGYNAYTMPDRTHYWLQAPKEDLPTLLQLEAARMAAAQNLCEAIPEAEFPRELDVVRNEIRQRYGQAQGLWLPMLLEEIFPKGHPYARTAGGLDANLVRISKKDVCQFMKDYYHPSRATVLVAGNIDPDEVGKLVMGTFGKLPRGEPKARVPVPPVETKKRRVEHALDLERPMVVIAWGLPPMSSDEFLKAWITAGSLSARAGKFARDWDFAASAGAFVLGADEENAVGGPNAPVLILVAELYKNSDINKAFDYMWKAAERAHWGVKDAEDAMGSQDSDSVAVQKAAYIMNLEPLSARTEEVANLMQFGKGVEFTSSDTFILHRLSQIDKVDVDGLRSFVEKNLAKSRGVELVFRADKAGKKADTQGAGKLAAAVDVYGSQENALVSPGEADKPVAYPKEPGILATAKRYQLPNGMNVVLLPYKTLPVMVARLEFAAGSAHEPANLRGVALAASGFLRTPPGADAFARLGISIGSGSGAQTSFFSARGITLYQREMIHALERWITAGVYDQESIEDWQKGLEKSYKLPTARQGEAFSLAVTEALYGPKHPYALTGDPTRASYKKLGIDALNVFRRKHYSAANATLYVVGNFDVDAVKGSIKEHFGGWGRGHKDKPVLVRADKRGAAVYLGAPGRDVLYTQIQFMFPRPMGIDERLPHRLLASQMLQQAMGRVRTRLGSTYGISGGWGPSVGPSSYFVGGTCESAQAVDTLAYIREEIENLRKGTNHEVEFVRARRAVMKSLLGRATMTGSIAGALANQQAFGLPPDSQWRVMKQVATAKPADVLRVLEHDLDLEKAVVALSADDKVLRKLFDSLGVSDPKIIEMPEK
jgi:zinc protease